MQTFSLLKAMWTAVALHIYSLICLRTLDRVKASGSLRTATATSRPSSSPSVPGERLQHVRDLATLSTRMQSAQTSRGSSTTSPTPAAQQDGLHAGTEAAGDVFYPLQQKELTR